MTFSRGMPNGPNTETNTEWQICDSEDLNYEYLL